MMERDRTLAILLLLTFAWLLVVCGPAKAQTQPVKDVHPVTGEEGTWIPHWLRDEHVVDTAMLRVCQSELQGAGALIIEQRDQITELNLSVKSLQNAGEEFDDILAASDLRAEEAELRTERLSRALWGTGSGLVVAIGAFVVTVFTR